MICDDTEESLNVVVDFVSVVDMVKKDDVAPREAWQLQMEGGLATTYDINREFPTNI